MMNKELKKTRGVPPRHFNSLFLIPYSLFLFSASGCQPFVLSDNTAADKILATHYWADLEKQYSAPLVCWVVTVEPNSRELYVGTDKSSHVVRIRDCRVTADGRVWVNSDATMRTERWTQIN